MSQIEAAIYKFVEHELYDYKYMRKDLKELKDDIAFGIIGNTTYDNFSTTEKYSEGSGTENAGIKLMSNKVATRLLRTLEAIDRAVSRLDEEKGKLFNLKYMQRKHWKTITLEIGISRATFFRWQDEIVEATAKEMGLI
ncbi:hypothetical protein [Halocella sp. SP3-1]|uniref:hypothetical protein n=1 Tax=Halocella sp. SP3-1 TaxID=2382161 RepID=UPI000F74CDDE|nr:hypothetical protein [Halocella sp. SP3-1]AZO96093.1 hypothetical protein D7D81_16675 [Halocella sp. SP3-1]